MPEIADDRPVLIRLPPSLVAELDRIAAEKAKTERRAVPRVEIIREALWSYVEARPAA